MTTATIIVAGGKGERMHSNVPKQFIELNGLPILMHTIQAFYNTIASIEIIVVLPENQIEFWNELCEKHRFKIPHITTIGGNTRFHSVKNGLAKTNADFIAVHDGVRPLVNANTIINSFESVQTNPAVIPVLALKDSIRQISENESFTVDRNLYKLVQTPQVFQRQALTTAYKQAYSPLFTDDASVVEAMGIKVTLIEGNEENIKVTTPFDLKLAEIFLKN